LMDVNTATGARFRGYLEYFRLDYFGIILGRGYGNVPDMTYLPIWFSGASYMLYGTGIIGFLVCITMFIALFFRSKNMLSKVICVVFAFLFFTDDSFMSHVAVLYLSFICMSCDNVSNEVNHENPVLDG